MAVSRDDVRHIAGLARLGVPDDRLDALARELSGILDHMKSLETVPTSGADSGVNAVRRAMPLAADEPPSVSLQRSREQLAPRLNGPDGTQLAMKDGFYLVPRLATHEDVGDAS